MTEVAAALIWNRAGQFLICQRPAHKARGLLWEFLGGKAEEGESLKDALIRECQEELGVTVEPGSIFIQLIHEYPDIKIRLTLFNSTITSGKPKLLEHNDMRWIYPSEIPNYDFCPADEVILKMLMKSSSTSPLTIAR